MCAQPYSPSTPQGTQLIIVMGVSGSGKSTLAERLAAHLGYRYLDADDFHSPEAKALMAAGQPLNDEMRRPWVDNLCAHLRAADQRHEHSVLAFSGLRRAHRQIMREQGLRTLTLFLDGSEALIQDRANQRSGHFANPGLVRSQFETLESPLGEPNVYRIDVAQAPAAILQQAIERVAQHTNSH